MTKHLTVLTVTTILLVTGLLFYLGRGEFFAGILLEKILSGEAVVEMTENGFIPEEITVRRGTKVIFVNQDSLWRWPASDLHPTHNVYPEFDPREAIAPSKEWEFTFEKRGEWHYHDHLAPYILGKIIVVE